MTIQEAYTNLDGVLASSRILTPDGALTRNEHIILVNSLQLLFNKAKESEELKKELKLWETGEKVLPETKSVGDDTFVQGG